MKPEPQTFAERLRGIMSWMLFAAGVVCTAMAGSVVLITWQGGWTAGTEHQRLSIIGWALLGSLTGLLAVIVSLAIGGPVGRFKGRIGRDGAELEAEEREDSQPGAAAKVTTTTVIAPQGGGQ